MACPKSSPRKPHVVVEQDSECWRAAYDIVKAKLLENADRRIQDQDKHARPCSIKLDDRVFIKYVKNKPGDNKLSQRFQGPYRVVSQKSPTVFRLKHLANNKIIEAHVENMKVVQERMADISDVPEARLPFPEPELPPPVPAQPADPSDSLLEHAADAWAEDPAVVTQPPPAPAVPAAPVATPAAPAAVHQFPDYFGGPARNTRSNRIVTVHASEDRVTHMGIWACK